MNSIEVARITRCGADSARRLQASLMINGTCPPACFLSRLAAFFSLAVRTDCFLDSLLLRWILE